MTQTQDEQNVQNSVSQNADSNVMQSTNPNVDTSHSTENTMTLDDLGKEDTGFQMD